MCGTTLSKGYRPGAGHRWWLKVLASLAREVASLATVPAATANRVTAAGLTGSA